MRKPLFISSVLGANIFEVAACGRENADGSVIGRGGEECDNCTALAGGRAAVGECVGETEDWVGTNVFLVTVWGLVLENKGNFVTGTEFAEMGTEGAGGEVEVGEGVGTGAGTNSLVVTTWGRDTTKGRPTGFTSGSTSCSPAVSWLHEYTSFLCSIPLQPNTTS